MHGQQNITIYRLLCSLTELYIIKSVHMPCTFLIAFPQSLTFGNTGLFIFRIRS